MLQPQYTMYGFNWFDHRGTEGVGFIKALRTMLTNYLPQILPELTTIVGARFAELYAECPAVNGQEFPDPLFFQTQRLTHDQAQEKFLCILLS
jgi:hypothetical protein